MSETNNMNQNKQMTNQMTKEEQNKQQNKAALGKFLVIVACSMVFGGVVGWFGVDAIKHYDVNAFSAKLGEMITIGLGCVMPVIMTVLFFVATIYAMTTNKMVRKEWKEAQNLDDDAFDIWYEKADAKLEKALEWISLLTIVNYFGFSVNFYAVIYCEKKIPYGLFLLSLAVLIATIVSSITMQSKIVDMVKLINPEKSGSVYDTKFQDKWIDSCDEYEKLMVYQATYKVFKVLNVTCTTLWMVFTILALVIKISIWPVTIISFIWLLMNVTYTIECKKLSKGKGESSAQATGSVISF